MKISPCEFILALPVFMVMTFVWIVFGEKIHKAFTKLKGNRFSLSFAAILMCTLCTFAFLQIRTNGGIQLVDCDQKKPNAATAALAMVSLPCPCGCGTHTNK